jgi:hypothetical protein
MAELCSNGIGVPILFPIDAQGIAVVSELHLSIRFSLKPNTIWVEREIFHPDTGLLVHIFHETSKVTVNGNVVWELGEGKYRVHGWPDSQTTLNTEILTPLRSSTAAFSTPPVISVKIEPGLDNVIDLSDSSTEDVPVQHEDVSVHDSPHLFPSSAYVTSSLSLSVPSPTSIPSTSNPPQPIVQCLRRLGSMPGSKNVLKNIDYDKLQIHVVNHLPPRFDGTQLFVLPAAEVSSSQSRAKSLDGIDKQYDGHVWTKTQTTNILISLHSSRYSSTSCEGWRLQRQPEAYQCISRGARRANAPSHS